MISLMQRHTYALLKRMVVWDAVETMTHTADYESGCTLARRGLAAKIGKRGRSGRVWFEPTAAGRELVLRPPPWNKVFERMDPVRGMPAPRKILTMSYEDRGWFEDIDGKEEL